MAEDRSEDGFQILEKPSDSATDDEGAQDFQPAIDKEGDCQTNDEDPEMKRFRERLKSLLVEILLHENSIRPQIPELEFIELLNQKDSYRELIVKNAINSARNDLNRLVSSHLMMQDLLKTVAFLKEIWPVLVVSVTALLLPALVDTSIMAGSKISSTDALTILSFWFVPSRLDWRCVCYLLWELTRLLDDKMDVPEQEKCPEPRQISKVHVE